MKFKIEQFKKALGKLQEVRSIPINELERDGYIQRFEFTFDICWKSLKVVLQENFSIEIQSPNQAFREAFKVGLLEYEEKWLDMTRDRNLSAHTYSENIANKIIESIPFYTKLFSELLNKINI
jgi:nucleotidyltransferase substrate binding protein (TIGR01987 family)